MNLGNSIRAGTRWLTAGSVGRQVLQFAVGVILARLLVPADFGFIVTIQIFTGLASLMASGGTGEALVQAKEVTERHYQVAFTVQITIAVVIYLGFFAAAPWFANWFGNALYIDLLRVSTLTFLIRPFVNVPRARLRREMRFKALSLIDFTALIITSTASISLAYLGYGPWSLVLSGLIGMVWPLIAQVALTHWRPTVRFDPAIARALGGFGFKFSVNEFISYLRWQTSNLIISRTLGPSMVGLYNKGDSLSKLPFQTVSSAVYQPVFRALAAGQENLDQSKYIYFRTISLLVVYTLPFYIGLAFLAKPFIEVVYGSHWIPAAQPLQILAPAGLFFCIGHPAGAVLAAQNKLEKEIVVQLMSWLVVAIACLTTIRWGIAGIAAGMLVSHIYSTIHMTWVTLRCLRSTWKDLLVALTPGLILNSILLAVLLVGCKTIFGGLAELQPAYFLLAAAITGAFTYTAAFLYLPIPALATESARWRRALHLARN